MAKSIKTPAHHRFFSLSGIELFTELSRIKSPASTPAEKGQLTKWLKEEGSRAHLRLSFRLMDITQEQAHRALFETLLKVAA